MAHFSAENAPSACITRLPQSRLLGRSIAARGCPPSRSNVPQRRIFVAKMRRSRTLLPGRQTLEPGELGLEVVQPQRALRQRRHVPRPEVEVGPSRPPCGLPPGQPGPLPQLVADRLSGDAEVAHQLAVDEPRV